MRKARILCVDDYVPGLDLRKTSLELEGYLVDTVSSGTAAQALVDEPYDLLVLDYHLLDMNGADVARHWKCARPNVRIVLLSGATDIPPSALRLVDRYIAKAEPVSELMEAVAELTDRRRNRCQSRRSASATIAAVIPEAQDRRTRVSPQKTRPCGVDEGIPGQET